MSELILESWDPIWEKVFSEYSWGKYPSESLIQFIARNYYNLERPKTKILEVGCGPGANIWYLAKENFNAYGIDGSPTAIQQANLRLSAEGLSADLKIGDVVKLPYLSDFFDSVIDVECIYANDLENTNKILGEVARVLKSNGLFYSRTLSDQIYAGLSRTVCGYKSFKDVSDGPLEGKGFVRVMDENDIKSIYGQFFNIKSIDKLEYTRENGSIKISEFIIIANKK
jgi:2-polyprenyl-3-methyl-5-hydroxy-6-metoxy-1,4-benzoquinol methylase